MAQTATRIGPYRRYEATLYRLIETGAANTQLVSVFASARGVPCRIALVTVSYSAVPTQTGVKTRLTSGAGAAYDCDLNTGSANAQYSAFIPTTDLIIAEDDKLTVTAPAGGVGLTASVAVYLEELK